MSKTFRTSVQGLDAPPPDLFSAFIATMNARCRTRMRKRRKISRVARGRCFKRRVLHPPFSTPTRSRIGRFSPLGSIGNLEKKGSRRRSRENFLSGSFVTRTLLYIHEGFISGRGRAMEEGREEALTWHSDNRRWSIFACENVSAGKEIFFRIAHPSQNDSLAWVAFNTTQKDEMTVMMLDWS